MGSELNWIIVFTSCLCLMNKFHIIESQILPQVKLSNYLSNFPAINKTPNYVFSPFNLELALSVLNIGTLGCNASIPGLTPRTNYLGIRSIVKLLNEIEQDGNLTLKINNDLYAKSDVQLNDIYVRVIDNIFRASVYYVDFKNNLASVVSMINQKISNNTNGLIVDFIKPDQVDSNTVLLSVNSLYFKGTWKEPFNEEMVKRTFFAESGPKDIDMLQGVDMTLLRDWNELLNAQIIVKDYFKPDFKLVMLIPIDDTISLSIVEKNLMNHPEGLVDGISKAKEIIANLYMPKIDEEFEVSLLDLPSKKLDCWKKNGIDNIVKGSRLTITKINHKVKLEITAEGSEGAAVVESNIGFRMMSTEITMNKPFLYYIIHKDGPIIFKGRFANPS
ncbi:unnamed protein product [Gordionus sp. m RMFG-2023]|uniref:serine protease inhibitor-like n=1 Tax=Gordionus sp. m RMFG-2023 TaxID=3053472 RepID=UPI0030E4B98F